MGEASTSGCVPTGVVLTSTSQTPDGTGHGPTLEIELLGQRRTGVGSPCMHTDAGALAAQARDHRRAAPPAPSTETRATTELDVAERRQEPVHVGVQPFPPAVGRVAAGC